MSHGRLSPGGVVAGGVVGGVLVGGGLVGWPKYMMHFWLSPPLQNHRMTVVPFAVPAPLASRHSPDCAPVMVPLALTFHCWLGWPLQSQMMTLVPLAVPWPLASRHLAPL